MRTTLNALWAILAPLSFLALAHSATFTVTKTFDEGEGSMWWAVEQTEESMGSDTILFAIPLDDPGYNPEIGVWTIHRTDWRPYCLIDGGTYVDGFSQARFNGGDPNPLGPEIELKAYSGSMTGDGMMIHGDSTQIHGLCINGFDLGAISMTGWPPGEWVENGVVAGCYLGVDPTGSSAENPGCSGVRLWKNIGTRIGGQALEERNIIVGGWNVDIDSCSNIAVVNNYLGTDRTGTESLVGGEGLEIGDCIGPVLVQDNLIAADAGWNIDVSHSDGDDAIITILHNRIGVGLDGSPMGGFRGIDIHQSPGHLIKENVIAHTSHDGIYLSGDVTDYVTISRNSIYGCRGGIELQQEPYENESAYGVDYIDGEYGPGPNEEIDPCRCDSVKNSPEGAVGTTTVYFTCMRDCTVEVFIADYSGVYAPCPESGYDRVYSGAEYIGDAEELEQGDVFSTYRFTVSPGLSPGLRLTATATNVNGSTSEFWCSCFVPLAGETAEGCAPEGYRLLPPSPNPTADMVLVRYQVPTSGPVHLRVYDLAGDLVAELSSEVVDPREHAVLWDLTDSDEELLPSGVYLVRLTTGAFVATREVVIAR